MATSSVSKTSNIPHAVPRHHNNYARRCGALKAGHTSTHERVKRSTSSNIPCCPRQEAQAGGPGKDVHERETQKGGENACSGNSTGLDTIISEVLDFKQQNEALLQQLEESDKEIHECVLRIHSACTAALRSMTQRVFVRHGPQTYICISFDSLIGVNRAEFPDLGMHCNAHHV